MVCTRQSTLGSSVFRLVWGKHQREQTAEGGVACLRITRSGRVECRAYLEADEPDSV